MGGIVRCASLAQISRSFALTLESGIPMIQALNTIARASGNDFLNERVLALRDGVERGEGLYRTAQTVDLFTPLALQMIAIGAMILGPIVDKIVPGALYFAHLLLWVAAALTVYTGFVYLRAGLAHVRTEPAPQRRAREVV